MSEGPSKNPTLFSDDAGDVVQVVPRASMASTIGKLLMLAIAIPIGMEIVGGLVVFAFNEPRRSMDQLAEMAHIQQVSRDFRPLAGETHAYIDPTSPEGRASNDAEAARLLGTQAVDAPARPAASVYVDPTSPEGHAATERERALRLTPDPNLVVVKAEEVEPSDLHDEIDARTKEYTDVKAKALTTPTRAVTKSHKTLSRRQVRAASAAVETGGMVSFNTKTYKYHNSGCRYYDCNDCVPKSRAEARQSGGVPCKKCRG